MASSAPDREQLEADNRRIAVSFFEFLRARDFDAALALLDDDGTHWEAGESFYPEASGAERYAEYPMRAFKDKLRLVQEGLHDTPMDFEVDNVITSVDHVVLEVHNNGILPDGLPYGMVYCFIFEVKDGIIVKSREYADSDFGKTRRPAAHSAESGVKQALRERAAARGQ